MSIKFKSGTITTLLGPNGTGKTTFLNVIASRLPPSTGIIKIGGHDLGIKDINYMPQDPARLLFPHLTLRQNLSLAKSSKRRGKLRDTRGIAQFFPDDRVLDKYPGHCSGGEKQRTVFCRAIADIPSFPLALFDEPFAQISQDVKPDMYALLQSIVRQSGAVSLLVTHDIPEALMIGDQVMVLTKGEPFIFDSSTVRDPESYLQASQLRDDVRRTAFFQT